MYYMWDANERELIRCETLEEALHEANEIKSECGAETEIRLIEGKEIELEFVAQVKTEQIAKVKK